MLKLLQMLLSQRLLGVLLLLLLVLVVYLIGNLVGLEWLTMHLAAASIVVLLLIGTLLRQQVAAKAAGALEQALRAQGQAQVGSVRPDQRGVTEDLKKQFDESLQLLRSSKLGRGALYSIPWYLLIGPPGSGKSTLLRQSGLSFPYMTKGRSAIRGLGGTKNCDWWFADRGILLDTAGRFTTEAEDHGEWLAFLRMLKKGRKHRPVNGAIVAIGMPELIESTEAELLAYSENVRDRIDELTRELQTVFPVYVVFTKTDRLRGFVETFDTLKPDQRKQVWGFTMPYETGQVGKVAEQFGAEFDELYRALCVRRVDLLASDHFKKRRAQLCTFPLQFLRIKERLQSFLGNLQQDNPYQEVSPIRGVYFTSGTQEGTTIDRILKVLRPAELEQDVPEESRRCYFVDDLFNRVVFPDASLAGPTSRSAGKEKWLRIGGMVAAAALVLIATVVGWSKYAGISPMFASVQASLGVDPREAPLDQLRKNLDEKLELKNRFGAHLARGGVNDALLSRYKDELVPYAQKLLRDYVGGRINELAKVLPADSLPSEGSQDSKSLVGKVKGALKDLEILQAQVKAWLSDDDEASRETARLLWSLADGGGEHFGHMTPESRKKCDLLAQQNAVEAQVTRFKNYLAQAEANDLASTKRLTFDELFHNAAAARAQTVPCSAISMSQVQWSAAVLDRPVPSFLFSVAQSTAGFQMEAVLEALARDADNATKRAIDGKLLSDLPDSNWEAHVRQRRSEFLDDLRARFEQGWVDLLTGLRKQVESGSAFGAVTQSDEVDRLAVMPQLQRAHAAAYAVLGRGSAFDEKEKEKTSEEAKKAAEDFKKNSRDWLGKFSDAKNDLQGIERRAEAVQNGVDAQNQRVETTSLGGKAEQYFDDLEKALHRSILRRVQAECRAAMQVLAAEKNCQDWEKLRPLFPFNLDAKEEAEFPALHAALRGVLELDSVVQKLRGLDGEGYQTSQAYNEMMGNALFLRNLLANGDQLPERSDSMSMSMRLRLSWGGTAITRLVLKDGKNEVTSDEDGQWTVSNSANISLLIEVHGSGSQPLGIKDLVHSRHSVVGQRQGRDAGDSSGYWGLKRLFTMGRVTAGKEKNELVCELTLEGRQSDKIFVTLSSADQEVLDAFGRDWPSATFITPSPKIWKEEP